MGFIWVFAHLLQGRLCLRHQSPKGTREKLPKGIFWDSNFLAWDSGVGCSLCFCAPTSVLLLFHCGICGSFGFELDEPCCDSRPSFAERWSLSVSPIFLTLNSLIWFNSNCLTWVLESATLSSSLSRAHSEGWWGIFDLNNNPGCAVGALPTASISLGLCHHWPDVFFVHKIVFFLT